MNSTKFQFGGKERKFKFGLEMLGKILNHYETNIMGLGQIMVNNPFDITPVALYYGHISALRGQYTSVTLSDFYDYCDEINDLLDNPQIAHAISLFVDTVKKHLPKVVEDNEEIEAEEADKKKSTGTETS